MGSRCGAGKKPRRNNVERPAASVTKQVTAAAPQLIDRFIDERRQHFVRALGYEEVDQVPPWHALVVVTAGDHEALQFAAALKPIQKVGRIGTFAVAPIQVTMIAERIRVKNSYPSPDHSGSANCIGVHH